jgi:hypothetical protein
MIIKIAANNDANAKQLLKRTIEESKTSKSFITIGLAFLKTVYLAHVKQTHVISRHLLFFYE